MSLSEDIVPWREKATGMVSPYKNPNDHSVDNALLFTSTYMVLLTKEERDTERTWFSNLLFTCLREPGLMVRYPGDTGLESQDDYTGVMSVLVLNGGGYSFAEQIRSYGLQHFGFWNSANPGSYKNWDAFLARFVHFFPLLKQAAYGYVGIFGQLCFAAAFLLDNGPPESTSNRCQMFLMQRALYGKYKIVDVAINWWRRKMTRLYPGGLKDVYAIYFGVSHPFYKYAPKDFV